MKKLTDDDVALFREATKGVKPLKSSKRVAFTPKKTSVKRRQSQKDIIDPDIHYQLSDHLQETVSSEQKLSFSVPHIRSTTLRALRQGKIHYSAVLDLHGMTISMARDAISHFLAEAQEHSLHCILIIHGKGRFQLDSAPKLKNQVNNWLKQHPAVAAFCSAIPRDGGNGAVYVLLKR